MNSDHTPHEAASRDLPASAAREPFPVSEAAKGLRVVLDLLLQDMALEPVDPATLPWHEPILVLRSAEMDRFRAVLRQIVAHCPTPHLHVLSHARDEEAIRDRAPCDFVFHAYPTPGRYRPDGVPPATLERLQSVSFGTLLYIDPGTSADLFGEVEALFAAIQDTVMVVAREDGTFARTSDGRLRTRAEAAFLRLIEWYQLKLDSGLPDGPLAPDPDALSVHASPAALSEQSPTNAVNDVRPISTGGSVGSADVR